MAKRFSTALVITFIRLPKAVNSINMRLENISSTKIPDELEFEKQKESWDSLLSNGLELESFLFVDRANGAQRKIFRVLKECIPPNAPSFQSGAGIDRIQKASEAQVERAATPSHIAYLDAV